MAQETTHETGTDRRPDRRLPRYQALRDTLATRVERGEWAPGSPIPSESRLAREYGVSLGTIRQAIAELATDGILERKQGRGTYVRRSDFSASLAQCLRFRSSHARLTDQNTRIEDVALGPAPEEVRSALHLAGGEAINIDRRRLSDGRVFLFDSIWLEPGMFAPLLRMERDDVGPLLYRTYEEACGVVVVRADEALRFEPAEAGPAAILGVSPGTGHLVIERTSYDVIGNVLEWRRSHARAEDFEYRIEIR